MPFVCSVTVLPVNGYRICIQRLGIQNMHTRNYPELRDEHRFVTYNTKQLPFVYEGYTMI